MLQVGFFFKSLIHFEIKYSLSKHPERISVETYSIVQLKIDDFCYMI